MVRLFDEYDESRVKERGKRSEVRRGRQYRSPGPMTAIPRRASASSPGSVRIRSRYTSSRREFQEDDITRLPTVPPSAIWQDEPSVYEIERHLSLFPAEVVEPSPILPSSPSIDELATNPPPMLFQSHDVLAMNVEPSSIEAVIEADTIMDDTLIVVSSPPFAIDMYPTQVEDVVDVALTIRARELLRRNSSQCDQLTFISHPLDYLRGWLLGPGHLEFLFWLIGAVLLSIVLCGVLVMMGLGLGWMSFGHLGH